MARRKGKKGSTTVRSTSVLTALFAAAPALFILTNSPSGGSSPIGSLMSGSASWASIQNAGWSLAQNVIQNWVSLLILIGIVFVVVKVIRKAGSPHITKHLRL